MSNTERNVIERLKAYTAPALVAVIVYFMIKLDKGIDNLVLSVNELNINYISIMKDVESVRRDTTRIEARLFNLEQKVEKLTSK